MIKTIKISKLFGRFDYKLDFSEEGIMIITGPNGYGKSTILKMISNFCNDSLQKVLGYTFKNFTIVCDNSKITICKNEKTFKIDSYSFPYPDEKWDRRRMPPYMKRIGYDEYIDMRTNEHIKFRNGMHRFDAPDEAFTMDRFFYAVLEAIEFNSSNSKFKEMYDNLKTAVKQMNSVKREIGKVRFIQEQRLIEKREIPESERSYNQPKEEYITVISENSEKLKTELANIMKRHSSLSSELDSTYIKRLFDADLTINSNLDQVRSELEELQRKQEKLQKYGLAEIKNVSYIFTLDKDKLDRFSAELSIYLEDANAKYNVFESIINKLDLYERIVNQKLTFKKMKLSSSNGIEVVSDEGRNLSLSDLSSGEQEILVLFYKLIFESDVNLLLIDEPEISLHIGWQKEIMENLKSVVNLNKNIQVIIATHSPQIISHNWDLQIDLGGLYNG
ncbi:MAG: AAA family ATPase [Clostridia bacterium]|nr:AAA family ATPase [Clostridia bacterium]